MPLHRAIGAKPWKIIGFLACNHQQGRANLFPGRFCVFSFINNRIHPMVPRICYLPHPPVLIERAPHARHISRSPPRKTWIAMLNHRGELLERVVSLLDRRSFDLVEPFAHSFWRVSRGHARQSKALDVHDAANPLRAKAGV